MAQPTLFDKSQPGKRCTQMPSAAMAAEEFLPADQLRAEAPRLPELSEPEIARHYARLAGQNFNVDANFYPLGSCTMKYNPKVHEEIAGAAGFSRLHPSAPDECAQGALRLMRELETWLAQILGMDAVSLQPPAGAAGEFTSLRVFRAWHDSRGDTKRTRVIVPDTAHGTNPASVARCGWDVTVLKSGEDGRVAPEALADALGDDVAALMLTNPSTLGLFETRVLEVNAMVHEAGGLVYCDGANMNALLGHARPGDMGFDAVHVNLHKTFSTPHGGGGPGAGPIGVVAKLEPFLPSPRIVERGGALAWDWDRPESIGKVQAWFGNFLVAVRAWAYIQANGGEGLRQVARDAVLAANYIRASLQETWDLPYPGVCMHECVLSAKTLKNATGIRAADVAKRLLDYGIHPPTMYFPLIVEEALMIEPTETESKAAMDYFIEMMQEIAQDAAGRPDLLHEAPHETPVRRVDEVAAARKPILRWREE
ncbi:MAG: aminomethyl-transferring glycine dehydrogenase subunit GcvPB [candidate division WS1 bacterium]|jgi:glycine dehydrogenase subunit 2|nr:aminomethyl-transferring glycine dehydrogenase subunit GcvPB [candidate division WS1 bacterium]